MNKNLNLCEILKNVPLGTSLWTPLVGDVELYRIEPGIKFPIRCRDKYGTIHSFTVEGKYLYRYQDGECLIFPSRDQLDWTKFQGGEK